MPVPGGLDAGPPAAIAVLVSGQGTILEGLLARARAGQLGAPITLVVADRPDAPALGRAERAHVATVVVPRRPSSPGPWGEDLDRHLTAAGISLVVLDGFLSILPPTFLARWRGRVLNVHPSLLPRHGGPGMYGARVHAAVLAAGDRETGVTVHEVTEVIDGGPIVEQRRLAVTPSDTVATLAGRLRPLEIEALADAIRRRVRSPRRRSAD
ncbi:MAG TPA: phosphoribosylglycinamide formyltransferase [Thermoplasmata archaeon]|nr:phosphoribosylglycinamide formyltransferase [Thermoplasmata archaeon]